MLAFAALLSSIHSLRDLGLRREAIGKEPSSYCTKGEDCSPKSLKADVRAANAAEDMVDLALWQIVLGAVGIYLVARTLEATRAAVKEANDASDAARKAVEITDDHGRRQLRAYITVELSSMTDMEPGKAPIAAVLVTNSGQTPAYRVSTSSVVALVKAGELPPIMTHQAVRRNDLIIGSKFDVVNTKAAPFELTKDDIEDLKAARAGLVISGCSVYDDVFGRTWWTQFCQVYNGPKLLGRYHTSLNTGT